MQTMTNIGSNLETIFTKKAGNGEMCRVPIARLAAAQAATK